MTLELAIKSLENLGGHHLLSDWSSSRDAIKLGIEAIKREQRKRKLVSYHRDDLFVLLPGIMRISSNIVEVINFVFQYILSDSIHCIFPLMLMPNTTDTEIV